jgi:hypothetical protein
MRDALILGNLLLCGCASVPPPSACFTGSGDSMGWTLLQTPPSSAADMRAMAHENALNARHPPIEYWFRQYDGSVMLCEPFRKDGCDTSTTIFSQDASGAMIKAGSGQTSSKCWPSRASTFHTRPFTVGFSDTSLNSRVAGLGMPSPSTPHGEWMRPRFQFGAAIAICIGQ